MAIEFIAALAMGGVLLAAVAVTVFAALVYADRQSAQTEYETGDFSHKAGFRAASLPEDSLIRLERISLVNRAAAQFEYTVEPGWELILRVGRAGADLGAEEFEQIFREQVTLYYRDIRVTSSQNEGGAAALRWSKNGFDYLLVLPDSQMGLRGGIMPLFVQQTDMVESKVT